MTEGWVDCPSLGPGWQRREVLRKNGTRPGHSDTYYTSPRGEKIRSRVELNRLLGCSRDLTDFDFKRGVFVDPSVKFKKGSKRRRSPEAAATPPLKKPPDVQVLEGPLDQGPLDQKPLELKLELPIEAPANILTQHQEPTALVETELTPKPCKRRYRKHQTPILAPGKMGDVPVQETNSEETIVCASCQGQFPGVMLPSQRRCRWLCPDCRAQRRDFNREQRYYKGLECGMCQACKITEDCGSCCICLRRQKPGMKRQWKCLKRRCLKRKKKIPPKKDGYSSKKLTVKWKPTMERNPGGISAGKHRKKQLGAVKERKKVGRPPKHPTAKVKSSACTSTSRRNRKCGECEACLLKMDCGRCDFCCDKPKFGGRNLKRQKCRWRQCLHFAMVEESPSGSELLDLSKSRNTEKPEPVQQLSLKDQPEKADSVLVEESVKEHPIVPQCVKEEPEVPRHPTPPTPVLVKESDTRLPAVNLLIATSPKIKQEPAEPGGDRRPSNDSPIMEIYSLHDLQPRSQLDSVLREFLAELNEIPLPAHWEVLPPLGSPNLRLVQRSKHSTMSAAVIHIRPGLFFHVVVRDLPVPLEHELYASHPSRLTTVDEVVELICDLEAYRLCPGWPAGWHAGERSQACDVLVYSGCCPQCRLNPWPSGSGTR